MSAKILIVDDEPDVRDFLSGSLKRHRYGVATASDGDECVDMAGKEKFDLILLDILMPKLDGFQTLKKLRNNAATRQVPVVMLTAKRESSSIIQSMELGCEDYIMKPIALDELMRIVKRYVEA